jgi:peptidoglycan/xylan/chitin deacetylase (PgdA/CDA1 family)
MSVSFKIHARRAMLSTIAFSNLRRLLPSAGGRGVIFTLHHVRPKTSEPFDPNAHLEITQEFLNETIITAKAAGLVPAKLEDLPELLVNSDPSVRYCFFTLDDGNRNNAEFAAPVFRAHNVPYTIFICPGFVNRTSTMWWETTAALLRSNSKVSFDFENGLEHIEVASTGAKLAFYARISNFVASTDEDRAVKQIDALARSLGVDPIAIVDREIMNADELAKLSADPLCSFGGHALTHRNLARLSEADMRHEIEQSCRLVSDYGKREVTSFAFPYGWQRAAGGREFKACADLGLKVALTTQPGVLQTADASRPTGLKRVSLNGHFQHKRYVSALISGLPFKFT